MKYRYVFLDMDGTVIDSSLGVTNGAMYALGKFGIRVENRSELYKMIGPPLSYSFSVFFGLSKEDTEKAIEYYSEYYDRKGILENEVYDGIRELLEKLSKRGVRIILATSKRRDYAKRILDILGIAEYFDHIAGAVPDEGLNEKPDIMRRAISEMGISAADAVMVGDRKYDVEGAQAVNMDSIGVLFGFGTKEELNLAGATYIAEKPADVADIVLL